MEGVSRIGGRRGRNGVALLPNRGPNAQMNRSSWHGGFQGAVQDLGKHTWQLLLLNGEKEQGN